MSRFTVEGYGPDGTRRSLRIAAATPGAAREAALAAGLAPLGVAGDTGPVKPPGRAAQAAFVAELGALLAARIPLAEALEAVAEGRAGGETARAARQAAEAVRAGAPLSAALAAPGLALPGPVIGAVRAGERRGDAGGALLRAAETLDRGAALRARLRAALTYPAILLAVTLLSLGGILLGVVPGLRPVLLAAGAAAPPEARLLLAASDGLRAAWMPLGAGLLALLLLLVRLARSPEGRRRAGAALLSLPVLGPALRAAETGTALATAAELAEAGVPLAEAFSLAAEAVAPGPVRAALLAVAAGVREGGDPAALWSAAPALSGAGDGLIAAGLRTGRLAEMMRAAAGQRERAAEAATARLLAILPAAMTLLLGLLVGGVSLTVIGAILSVNDAAL